MDSQIFKCESCSQEYDVDNRIPRFISGCGHTLCTPCIQAILDQMGDSLEFQCPFDGGQFPIANKDVSSFPKNFMLIKMIEGNKAKKLCPIHAKETDLVCIDHNCFICGDCALFGGHKGHQIKRVAELENQIRTKSDDISDLLGRIDKTKERFYQQGDTILDNKRQILINSMHTRIENIIEMLTQRKELMTQEINAYFDNISNDMRNRDTVIREIDSMMAKVLNWRNQVAEKLEQAKAARENDNPLGLLEENVSIMTPFVEEWLQETQNAFNFTKLEEKVQGAKVVFDEEGIQRIRNFCSFQSGEAEEPEDIVLTKRQPVDDSRSKKDTVELEVVQTESEAPYTAFENMMEVSNEDKILEEENRLDDILKTFDFDVMWKSNNKGKTLCVKDNDKKTAAKPFWQKMYNSVVRKKDMLYGFQYLKDLRISCRDFTDNGMGNFAVALGGIISLETLHLDFRENRSLNNSAVFLLGENIVYLSNVKEIVINFSGCPRINSKGLYNISQGLSKLMNLTSLTLIFDGCSAIDNQGIFYMVNYLASLQKITNLELRFNGCYLITDDAFVKIGSLISDYIELQKLSLYFAECTRITNNSVIHLNQSVARLKSLTWFVLSFKEALDLTDNGLSQLSQALTKMTALVHLDVDFSKCYKLSNHGLAELGSSLMRMTTLRKLVCHFALCENINDQGLAKFSQGISKLRNLARLTLDFNSYEIKSKNITHVGFTELSSALAKLLSLHHLELGFEGFTTIGDEALIPLSKAIAQLATLKELVLDFMGCRTISDHGLGKLSETISKLVNLSLLWLIFKGCDYITSAGKEELLSATSYLKNLKSPLVIEY